MKSKSKSKRIAVALPSGITFVERILHGVTEYAAQRGGWSLIRIPERLDLSLDWLRSCDCDGAIVMISDEQAAETARSLRMPMVNLSAYMDVPDLPTVMVDQKAVGAMAARHLLERSFTHCAYYGASDMWYSRVRRQSFVETIEAAGAECRVLEVPSAVQNGEKRRKPETLEAWLRALPMPVGIMASTDLRACMAADACAMLGLRIPEDVVIVGVDNDPVSEFHDPPLSSVSRNDGEVGARAAQLLEHLMAGGSLPVEPILIHPDTIVCRRSTEALAIEDARIAKAVAYIRKNVHRPFGVEELLAVTAMPRRTFELHFQKRVGITPYSFINRCRVERASVLLTGPKRCSLTEIASLSGFSDLRRFRLVFRRLMGKPPASFQRRRQEVCATDFDPLESFSRPRRPDRLRAA
jgi:LacI family transcriptional regulator